MISVVFFDLYNTLVRYDPPRGEIVSKALKDFGVNVEPETFGWPFVVADEFINKEIAYCPLNQRSAEDKLDLFIRYHEIVMKEAQIEISKQMILALLGKMKKIDMNLVLYDDVIPSLKDLRKRRIILGLISNVDSDISSLLKKLGLVSLLQVVVTSQGAGFNKPQPEIFYEALKQAKVKASESIYVGDQYQIDIVGANQVGMKGILIDRGGYFKRNSDCLRIDSLTQVIEYI